jgi:predicted ATPase/class 3 adenylate cyclase
MPAAERDLPVGTITFVFTDIEGSTDLVTRLGDGYRDVLETHQHLLREQFSTRGGIEVLTEGDAFFVVFESAPQAISGAVQAQRALAAHDWPNGVSVRVRIGVHTGEGVLGADSYIGIDVHRAARIAAAGHGGQVLVSDATRTLVEKSLPEGVTLRDLGEHRLKDLVAPERLFQVVGQGLEADFPPVRTLEVPSGNLPTPLTSFVGRDRELAEVSETLKGTRLLTLTGPGGAGKTRLSLEAASHVQTDFEQGAFFVALASITDPELAPTTIGKALGLREVPDRSPTDVVIDHLKEREVLLVLDNFEQIMEAASFVGELLGATDRVKVIATSREALHLHGEHEYPVPPLGLPDVSHLPPLGALSQYEAVRLFIERAAAVKPGFLVTNENAPAVAEITTRLDGLPLAIELAAARVKLLAPEAILKRLGDRLSLLAGGPRDLPARQQTLRGAIDWSYDLLDEKEHRLFARLAVFVGGFTLEAAEFVCNPSGELDLDTLNGVASLVDKSLVRSVDVARGEPRFSMLQTIREYAAERLDGEADAAEIRGRDAAFFRDLAEAAEPELPGPDQALWLDRLEVEHDNLRSALEWAAGAGELETALRTVGAIWRFWQFRGHLREGDRRVTGLLATPGVEAYPDAHAHALEAAGGIRYWMADWDGAREAYEGCLRVRRELGDERRIAEALYNLAFVFSVPRIDVPRAAALWREASDLFQRVGEKRGEADAEWALADVYRSRGEHEESLRATEGALAIYQELDNRYMVGWALHSGGLTLLQLGRPVEAREKFTEALESFTAAGDTSGIALLLADFAFLAQRVGDHARAVTLYAAALAVERRSGSQLATAMAAIEDFREEIEAVRNQPGNQDAQARGDAMSDEEAVAYALKD